MYGKMKKILIFMSVFWLFICILNMHIPQVKADDTTLIETRKVVSVVFDNSGSMVQNSKGDIYRERNALYSLQVLIGLLNKNDTLFITPMNVDPGHPNSFKVNLAGSYNDIVAEAINQIPPARGGTPIVSVDNAIRKLTNPGDNVPGMPTLSDYVEREDNIKYEYWLIILTDGEFSNVSNITNTITNRISPYTSLNTIYYNFGEGELPQIDNYPFSGYKSNNSAELVTQMQAIANKMSGRFKLDLQDDQISGNKITLDLSKYDISFNSISIVAQNIGGKIVSAKYKGSTISSVDELVLTNEVRPGVIVEDMNTGYLASYNTYFNREGLFEIEFDVPITNKDDVSILVEPSLYMEPYLEYKDENGNFIEADMQYINSHLKPGHDIKVQYRVFDEKTHKQVNIEKLFGDVSTKVSYAGKSYNTDEVIQLVVGKNQISLDVTADESNYTLHSSFMCIIDKNPEDFRIQSKVIKNINEDLRKHKIEYEVYYEGFKIKSKEELNKFTISVKGYAPDHTELSLNYNVTSNGLITVPVNLVGDDFGAYEVILKVTSEDHISRTNEERFNVYPTDLEVEVLNKDKLSLSQYELIDNSEEVTFFVSNKGKEIFLDNDFLDYKLEIDGKDVTAFTSQVGGRVSIIPNKDTVSNDSIGDKNIKFTISHPDIGVFTAEYVFSVCETVYSIEALATDNKNVDIYKLKDCNATTNFRLLRDDKPLPYEEVVELFESGNIKVKINGFMWLNFLPCDVTTSVEEINNEPVIVCKVIKDYPRPFDSLFASFIATGAKEVEVSFNDVSNVDTFILNPVSLFSRIIRWIIIVLIILFIIHLVLYIIGFFILKQFARGYIIVFKMDIDDDNEMEKANGIKGVNQDYKEILIWHLKRFIPFKELIPQPNIKYSGATIVKKNNKDYIKFKTDMYRADILEGSVVSSIYKSYINEVSNGKTRAKFTEKVPRSEFRNIIQTEYGEPLKSNKEDNSNIKDTSRGYAYKEVNGTGELVVTKFILYIKGKKRK